jgi:hypothetical protein
MSEQPNTSTPENEGEQVSQNRLQMIDTLKAPIIEMGRNLASRKRVPEGEKIRKRTIREREAKIERHSKPKGERGRRESKVKKRAREALLDKYSRPKGQRKRKERG